MAAQFKIQKALPEKHGSLKKKGRTLGNWVARFFKAAWDGNHAVLLYSSNANMSSTKKISLEK